MSSRSKLRSKKRNSSRISIDISGVREEGSFPGHMQLFLVNFHHPHNLILKWAVLVRLDIVIERAKSIVISLSLELLNASSVVLDW